jgi:hypothetical protein
MESSFFFLKTFITVKTSGIIILMPKSLLKIATVFFFSIFSFLVFSITSTVFAADTTPPITTLVQTPNAPDGNNGWYVSPVQFDLTATDLESGVKEINYRINDGSWQTETFSDSLNLAPNPSFEVTGPAPSNLEDWETDNNDGFASYARDNGVYYSGFPTSSARIIATQGPWHSINNRVQFAAASPFANMSASVWVKTQNVTGSAYFKMYVVAQDGTGPITYTQVGQSNAVSGTNDWTQLNLNFVANDANAIGVYMDLGLDSDGTVWADAVTISDAISTANTTVTLSTDGSDQTLEYYSVDRADNAEAYGCPAINCPIVDIDLTAPGSWYGSGAVRGLGGSEHEVYVYTNVIDLTSGISTNTDRYMYHIPTESGFGHYENLIFCNTDWLENDWEDLLTSPGSNGENDVYIMTKKTDFCDSNWKICKTVRFYAEDVAGNTATKDYCINGPWLKFRGEGIVRSNQNIDMISEPEEHNTDGLIELGGSVIDFFTSSRNWIIRNSPQPKEYDYNAYFNQAGSMTTISPNLVSADGIYFYDGDYEINNGTLPNDYDNLVFNQIVFINGNLTIETDITVDPASTALFIVSGRVDISKSVENVHVGLFADGNIHTAYDISEGEATKTIFFKGVYSADKFVFERTLQGTGNQNDPSDSFTFEPKYLVQLRDYFGENHIIWKSVE